MPIIFWTFILTAVVFACVVFKHVRNTFAAIGICVFGLWLAGNMGIGQFIFYYGEDNKSLISENTFTNANTPKEIPND